MLAPGDTAAVSGASLRVDGRDVVVAILASGMGLVRGHGWNALMGSNRAAVRRDFMTLVGLATE